MSTTETLRTGEERPAPRMGLGRLARGRTVLIALAALGSAALVVAAASLIGDDQPKPAPRPGIEQLVAQAAESLNARTPFSAGAGMTVSGVSAEGDHLVYRVNLSGEVPADTVESVQARLQASNAAQLCNDADTRRMIGQGGVFEHRYNAPNGRSLRTLVGACGGEGAAANNAMPIAM